MYTINLTVGEKITDINEGNTTINDDGHYRLSGGFGNTITVTGGNPTIYLENVNISVGGRNAINITGGNPTIHVTGNNTASSGNNTGIAVSNGATVTIEGNSTADVLTANGGTTGSTSSATAGAGIGSSTNGACGDITIEDAVIVATAGPSAAGIGMGCNYWNSNSPTASIGKITITDSDVTASGGDCAAAIGFSMSESLSGNGDTYRAGRITITTEDEAGFLSKLKPGINHGFSLTPQRIGKGSYNYTPTFLNTDGTGPWEGVVINGTSYQDGVQ